MCSVSCSKIDKKLRGNSDVPFWGFVQKLAPMFIGDGVESFPSTNPFNWNAQIASEFFTPPSYNQFSHTFHVDHIGITFQKCQGITFQCISRFTMEEYSS